jgi:hypothetical protein
LLQHGALSPDAQARLTAATTRSRDQQGSLERGDLVLPRDQMAYLSALSRGMDGKTTEGLRNLTLRPDGDQLVDGMRLATNPRISSTPGADGTKIRGSQANAPSALRDILTDPTVRVPEETWKGALRAQLA